MSGHGSFIQIGNNRPINSGNIGNVGNIQQPEEVKPQPLNVEGEEPKKAAQEKVNTRELTKQLDVLLLQAAQVSTKGIDAEALKVKVHDLGLDMNELNELNSLIDKAATSMAALDKFTGSDLATATTLEMTPDKKYMQVWDTEKEAGKAIKAALDAQADLSEKLFEIIGSKKIPREAKAVLESAAMTCDLRSCEIGTLVMEFSLAVSKMRFGDITTLDKEVRDRLNTKVFALMGEKALTMHGTTDALAHMQAKLEPLAKHLDEFAATPDKRLSSEAFTAMRQELNDAKTAFATLAHEGYKVGESRVMPDKAFMDAAKEILEQIEKRMNNAREKLAQAVLRSCIDSIFAPPRNLKLLDAKFRPLLKLLSSRAVTLTQAKEELCKAAQEYAKEQSVEKRMALDNAIADYKQNPLATEAERIAETIYRNAQILLAKNATALNAKVEKAKLKMSEAEREKITPELVKEFAAALKEYCIDGPEQFKVFFKNDSYYKTQLAHLEDVFKTIQRMGEEDFLTSKSFLSAFKGELAPTTLIEARVHGMMDDDVDSATDQSNVVGYKNLGSGKVNTVTAVLFKNGETKVFKPEAPGREGMEHAVYVFEGYEKNQQMAQLNMATQKTANVLGLDDVMSKTSVGKFNGQYGIFMEKAKGTDMPGFVNNENVPKGSLNGRRVQMLPYELHLKVQGQMMRKCNRLDWLDIITGQADRHNSNVFVNVGQDNTVEVKAIDNDVCYPAFRIGMNKYVLKGRHLSQFKDLMDNASYLYGEGNQKAALKRLQEDPGITKNEDGSYTIDASNFQAPELNYCLMLSLGVYSNYVPNVIDKELYERLQTLKAGSPQREEYLADLKKRISPAAFKAAVQRLDDAIRHADELAAKGRVYSEADWNDHDKQKAIFNDPNDQKPSLEPLFNAVPDKTHPNYTDIEEGIYHLTQSNYKRNGFCLSAKPNWFK